MKRLPIFSLFFCIYFAAAATEPLKTGKNLGFLPAISYNSDEGFQYGAVLNLFNYGNGSRYPGYDYSAYLECSRFTKGSSLYRFYFDTDKLLKGIRSFFEICYLKEDMLDFYGFNGYKSIYSTELTDGNRTFYRMSQKQARFFADFKGNLISNKLFWLASYNLVDYRVGAVDYNKLNKGLNPEDPDYLDMPSLYEKYVDYGIIRKNEAKGGLMNILKAGILYDSRNRQNNPSRGVYTEALIEIAPGMVNNLPYYRYSFVHRQYQEIVKNKLNAALRLGIQDKIGGNSIPFFRKSQMISPFAQRTSPTGLGGVCSLRGILKNRVIGDGFAYGNFELRWRAVDFRLANQNFYIGVNGFLDSGMITDPVDWNISGVKPEDMIYFDNEGKDGLHRSAGGGLKIAMNENFVISVEMGKAFDERDASGMGTYINLNYMF